MPVTLGAHEVINHYTQDIAEEVQKLTSRRGVDVVVEHVGQATWDKSVKSLARGGRLVTCGATSGWAASIDLRHLFARQLSLLGSYMGTKGELLQAAQLFFAGKLTPVVRSRVPARGGGRGTTPGSKRASSSARWCWNQSASS